MTPNDVFPNKPNIDPTLLDEILEPKLFELRHRAQRQSLSREAPPVPADWKCLNPRQSGWIPLDHPALVYKAMVPGKTRLDNKNIPPEKASELNRDFIGQDERKPWTNTLDRPYRWICKLQIAFQSRNNGSIWRYGEGSGVLIGNSHVLTTAHSMLNREEGDEDKKVVHILEARAVVVIPGLNGIHDDPDRVMPFGWSWGSAYRTMDKVRDEFCKLRPIPIGYDFAVIKLVDDLGNRSYPVLNGALFGHWGDNSPGSHTLMQFKKSSSIRGVRVNILGYPGDRCRDSPVGRAITQLELNNCSASDLASVPWLSVGRIVDPGVDSEEFADMRIEHYVAHGMSGSPVWMRWKGFRNMLGLGLAVQGKTNWAVRFTKEALKEISSWIK